MNSKVGEYWFNTYGKKRGIGVDIGVKVFRLFPLPKTNSKNFNTLSNEVIKLVNQAQELNKHNNSLKLQTAKEQNEKRIEFLITKINEIVYQLYDLTKDEIKIVEGK
jgi:adenine-specific DNA-methyltransferase